MRLLRSLLKSVWIWLIVIASVSYLTYAALEKRSSEEDRVDLGDLKIPVSPYALTKTGTVEIEGGIVKVSASRTGTFKAVYVKEGDLVAEGQLLAEQESRDDVIAIRSAELAIENAKIQKRRDELKISSGERDLERARIQIEQDAIAQSRYDSQKDALEGTRLTALSNKNSLEKLETNLDTARLKLARRKLFSPVNGQILESNITAGEGVSAQNVSVAFKIIPAAPKQVRVKVDEKGIDKIFVGQEAVLTSGTKKVTGYVISIGEVFTAAETGRTGSTNTVDVIVAADDIPLRLGQGVLVQFMKSSAQTDSDASYE